MKQNLKNKGGVRPSQNMSIVSRHRWLLRLAAVLGLFTLMLVVQPTESRAQFAPPLERNAPQSNSPLSAGGTITATKIVDKVTANPGDTLTYTVTVTNNSVTDATNVQFTDTLSSTLTLIGSSVAASPVAVDDTYPQTVIGNVSINSANIPYSVVSNDYLGLNPPITTTISAYDATSAQCVVISCVNNVSMTTSGAGMGEFTYNPPPGYTGSDSFTYTLSDNANASSVSANRTATVTLNISGMVWFINNNAAACTTLAAGCGRLSNPFSTLAAFNTLNNGTGNNPAANDDIFVYESATSYLGGVTLLSGQKLIGQDSTSSLAALTVLTPPSGSSAFPAMNTGAPATTIVNAAGNGVTVNSSNTLNGFTVSDRSLAGISGNGIGTLTVNDVSVIGTGQILSLNNGTVNATFGALSTITTTQTAIVLSNLAGSISDTDASNSAISSASGVFGFTTDTLSFTYNGNVTHTGANPLVNVNGHSTGTITFQNGTLTSNNGGILFANGDGTYNFNGTTTLSGLARISIFSGSGGSYTFGSNTSVTNPSNVAFEEDGSSATITYNGTLSSNTAFKVVSITNNTGGTVTFGGAITGSGSSTGIGLTSNTGATINFTDGINLSTGANTAFSATGGGTVNATQNNTSIVNTLATTTGTALDVANTSIGASGLTFRSISSNGATNGIVLNTTGSSGGLTVSGNGGTCTSVGTCTGGTIQSASVGVSLNSTTGVSIDRMFISNTQHSGVTGTLVTDFSFTNGKIDNSGTLLGSGDSNIAFNNGEFSGNTGVNKNISGALTLTGSTLTNAYYSGIDVYQFDGTISNANISNNTLTSSTSTANSKSTAILLQGFGSASTVASITKGTINFNTITNFPSNAGIFVSGGNATSTGAPAGTYGADNTTNIITINNNTITGQSSPNQMGTQGIAVTTNGRGTGNFGMYYNSITNVKGNGIQISAFGLTTLTTYVISNTINAHNINASQGIGAGTGNTFANSDTPTLNLKVGDGTLGGLNNISNTDGNGILIVARSATGHVNARVLKNMVAAPIDSPPSGTSYGIRLDAGNAASGSGGDTVCLDISANTTTGDNDGAGTIASGIGLRRNKLNNPAGAPAGIFGIVGLPVGSTATPAVENYVNSQNPGSASGSFGVGGTTLISATDGFSNCSEPAVLALSNTNQQFVAQNEIETSPIENAQASSTNLNSANAFNFPFGFANLFKQTAALTRDVKPVQSVNLANPSVISNEVRNLIVDARDFSQERLETLAPHPFGSAGVTWGQQLPPFVSIAEASALNNSGIRSDSFPGTNPLEIPLLSVGTVSVGPIPTIPVGKSVTIKFQATIENPFTSGSSVSNQGTVTCNPTCGTVNTTTATTNINLPDLRAAKTNNVSGTATLGSNWVWTIPVTNTGTFTATFSTGQTILSDNLPNSNIGYTLNTPSILLSAPNSGTVDCSINGSDDLSCTANGAVTLGINGVFDVQLTATPTTTGAFANPRVTGGSCSVDPNNVVNEGTNEGNNACSNSVTVTSADLVISKANNVGGTVQLGTPFTWTLSISNTGNGAALFPLTTTILTDTLDNSGGLTYGTPKVLNPVNVTNSGSINCAISGGSVLSCVTTPITVIVGATTGRFDVAVPVTPTIAATYTNPRSGGTCAVDPNNVVSESNEGNNNCNSNTVTVTVSDLTIAKSHSGNFTQGQVGATYTITATNIGNNSTSGTVFITDTLPSGLTATGFAGTGWACTLSPLACSRSNVLAPSSSYASLTLTVTVAANAPALVTNSVQVAGGGEANLSNDSTNDPTNITQLADLTIAKTHGGNFSQGQVGASYLITVTNSGFTSTSGTVTVTDTLPVSLTATGFSGTNWSCASLPTLSCSRSDALTSGNSYEPIALTVNVASTAPALVTNTAFVSGGSEVDTTNDSASDPTTINTAPDLVIAKSHSGDFTQGQPFAGYTITVTNNGGVATSSTMYLTDTLPASLTPLSLGGSSWVCTLSPLACSRTTPLGASASATLILTVSVASNAPTPITNTVQVAGGGEFNPTNDIANDVTNVQSPPIFTSGNNTTFTTGSLGNFNVTATGFPTATMTITQTGTRPGGVSFTDNGGGHATLSGTPNPGTGGIYPLTFNVSNGIAPDASQPFTLTVNEAPAITSANNTSFIAGQPGSFTVTTSGFPTTTMSITETGSLPSNVNLVDNHNGTATLSGTPVIGTGGLYTITLGANNGVAPNANQTFTLTVDQGPAFTSANNTTFTVGASGIFTVTTTGYPKPAITKNGSLPTNLNFVDNHDGTATLSGIPTAGTGGVYLISFDASNGFCGSRPVQPRAPACGTPEQAFTLTVDEAPAITSANAVTFTVGTLGNFTVTTTGFPTTTMEITGTGALPSNVTFVDNHNGTGTLSGTPIVGTGGVYALTFTADNGVSPDPNQSFTLTVDESPAITSANNTTFTVGTFGTFNVTTRGYPYPNLCVVDPLPLNVIFTDNGNGTGTLSGTPQPGTGGIYTFGIRGANGFSPQRLAPESVCGPGLQTFTLTVDEAPTITSANAATFLVGTVGSFNITATGFPTATMSITRTGTLPGGVSFTDNGNGHAILTGNPNAGTGGVYPLTFGANNGVSPNASQAFTLTVDEAPSITSANSAIFIEGLFGTFPITTTGFPTTTMTIAKSGALPSALNFTDNGNATATINGTPGAGTANVSPYPLTLFAGNGIGLTATQSFNLYVDKVPSVAGQPSNQTVCAGNPASFTSTGSGIPAPTIQWEFSTNSGGSFSNVVGAITTTLTFNALGSQNNNQYRAAFTNRSGLSRSNAVTLTVNTVPTITVNPAGVTTTPNQPVSFSANATSNPAPTVRWQVSTDGGATFNDIPSATSTTYSFTSQPSQNGNQYRAVFTSTCGSTNTNPATLKIVNFLFRLFLPLINR